MKIVSMINGDRLTPAQRINIKTGATDFTLSKDSYGTAGKLDFALLAENDNTETGEMEKRSFVSIGGQLIMSTSDILFDGVQTLADALEAEGMTFDDVDVMLIGKRSRTGNTYACVVLK